MYVARFRKVIGAPPRPRGAVGHIDIFEIEEQALIETTQPFEEISPDQQECTHHLIHLSRAQALPNSKEMGWEDRGEEFRQTSHAAHKGQERGETSDTGVRRAIRSHAFNSTDPDGSSFFALQQADRQCKRPRQKASVRVEKQQVGGRGPFGTLVAGGCEAEVRTVADHRDRDAWNIQCPGRTVGRPIVHDHHPAQEKVSAQGIGYRSDAITEQRLRVPCDDNDVELRDGHRTSGGSIGALKQILVLTVYPVTSAGTRLRAEQYRPYLREVELDLAVWSLIPDRDLQRWYDGGAIPKLLILTRSMLRTLRLPMLIKRSAVVMVLREVLPFGPPMIELYMAARRPLIWDVDDAVWEPYTSDFFPWLPRRLRKSSDKYRRICSAASQVWAGSEVLASWCTAHNDSVKVVPTVVDVPPERPPRTQNLTVGWVGSHATERFLRSILAPLAGVRPKPSVVVVGSKPMSTPDLELSWFPWSPAAERRLLDQMSVGLYPIDRFHPLAEGKAGLKAVLYMSQGIPCVLTPTTTNASLVRDGVEGLHAEHPEDWTRQVQTLLTDPELWEACSSASHRRALKSFSLAEWGPVVARYAAEVILEGPD